MFKKFYPDEYRESSFDIDYDALWERGVRGLLFDIDNTLAEHGMDPDERAITLMAELKAKGFKICLLSNNKEERVARFNRNINAEYVYKSGKPSLRAYTEGMKRTGTKLSETVFIGDQIFTDIFGANRAGMYCILVKPIAKHEEIQIVIKRKLEKIVLFFYNRKKGRQ